MFAKMKIIKFSLISLFFVSAAAFANSLEIKVEFEPSLDIVGNYKIKTPVGEETKQISQKLTPNASLKIDAPHGSFLLKVKIESVSIDGRKLKGTCKYDITKTNNVLTISVPKTLHEFSCDMQH